MFDPPSGSVLGFADLSEDSLLQFQPMFKIGKSEVFEMPPPGLQCFALLLRNGDMPRSNENVHDLDISNRECAQGYLARIKEVACWL